MFRGSYLCFALKTVIIAGGKGTRLGHLTGDIPKPLIPVAGKPVLEHQFELLAAQGFREVILTISHFGNKIREFAGNGQKWGLSVSYAEEPEPLGTAGIFPEIQPMLNEDFLVLYADVIFSMDLQKLVDFHRTKKSAATLVVHPNDHPYDSDLVDCDENGKITHFYAKPHIPGKYYRNLVNAAVYLFSPEVISFIEKNKKQDFGKDIFPKLFKHIPVFAYNTTEYLKDMGTPGRIGSVEKDILSGKVERKNYRNPQKAIFLDRDGVMNEDTGFIKSPDEFELYPFAASAIKKINQSDYAAIVVTNQSVVARNLCTEEELRMIHNKMEWQLGKSGAKIDALYYCPHHPDKGFPEENPAYKTDCSCRKPKPGMLFRAAKEFHIDLQQSFMIGDSDRDREAGKSAGCVTLGVRTGKGCSDLKSEPDFMVENLEEAIDFILNEPFLPIFQDLYLKYSDYPQAHKPFVVLISGQARTGKSMLASYLKIQFQRNGLQVLRVNADDWIMPLENRTGEESVEERFRLKSFVKDMNQLFNREPVKVLKYDSKTRGLKEEVTYHYHNQDVIILEGALLLSSETLRNLSDICIFVSQDEAERKKRFMQFYRWKGLSEDEAEKLYGRRLSEECEIIAASAQFADIRIKN